MAKRQRVHVSREVLSSVMSLLGQRGGKARAERLTPERRSAIARQAVAARIAKHGQATKKQFSRARGVKRRKRVRTR